MFGVQREHALGMALEQLPGVPQVLLGVGLGGGDALEGLVEDGDDAALLDLVRRETDPITLGQLGSRQLGLATATLTPCLNLLFDRHKCVAKERWVEQPWRRSHDGYM